MLKAGTKMIVDIGRRCGKVVTLKRQGYGFLEFEELKGVYPPTYARLATPLEIVKARTNV